jgi:hypothetical protein
VTSSSSHFTCLSHIQSLDLTLLNELSEGDGQVGVSPKGPKGFPDRMDKIISNNDEILLRWAFSIKRSFR